MSSPQPIVREVISHWCHLLEGMRQSPREFYDLLERAISARRIPDTSFSRMEVREGGLWTAKRLYLRVWRKNHIIDICGAPFGDGFFVSWWLSELPGGCVTAMSDVPLLNILSWLIVRPVTYYKIDTALMFQGAVHGAVLEVVDQITADQGTRRLPHEERRPIMREFLRMPG